jgi:hypothetical protein
MDLDKAVSFLMEQQAESQARFDARTDKLAEFQMEAERRHAVEIADIRLDLRRAIRSSVIEARQERKRRHTMYEELVAAQQVTEEKLQRLIDSLNGNEKQYPLGERCFPPFLSLPL